MKMQMLCSLLLSLAYAIGRSFNPFGNHVSSALGAKQGQIAAPSGADAVIKSLGDASPVVNTLAGVMRDALGAAVANKIAIINLKNRTVTIVPSGTTITSVTGATGLEEAAFFTKDDPTKASSPWYTTAGDGAHAPEMEEITVAVKPALSVESLANRVEDAFLDLAEAEVDASAIIVVDQANATFKVYEGTEAQVAAVNAATLLAEDAHFVQTLVSSAGAQFGE